MDNGVHRIAVLGDITVDWFLTSEVDRSRGLDASTTQYRMQSQWQPGGAVLLRRLMRSLVSRLNGTSLLTDESELEVLLNDDPSEMSPLNSRYHHTFSLWERFNNPDGIKPSEAWRISKYLGLSTSEKERAEVLKVGSELLTSSIIVLDDQNLSFASSAYCSTELKKLIGNDPKPWIILKVIHPFKGNALISQLIEEFSDRLIVIMHVDHLRSNGVTISKCLSWERSALDLLLEINRNSYLIPYSNCAHVVVSFDTTGALVISNHEPRLVFDPLTTEGSWNKKFRGQMRGYLSILTTSTVLMLVKHHNQEITSETIDGMINSSIESMRKLHSNGYITLNGDLRIDFPFDLVIDTLLSERMESRYVSVKVPIPEKDSIIENENYDFWTILYDNQKGEMQSLARSIVKHGIDENSIFNFPIARHGKLVTIDRREIEGYQSILTLINEYCQKKRNKRPLSIAVLGAPGSGKSFGVKEIATSVTDEKIKDITVNLSQLPNAEALHEAFHQVRDIVLGGNLPLVFFDEFDTKMNDRDHGWLYHFLAPMQDGTFQHGQITHSIGRSIFVFAGGMYESFQSFKQAIEGNDLHHLKNTKGMDFISRLHGYMNVLGPNKNGKDDFLYLMRRAVLLRSMFERFTSHLIGTDRNDKEMNIDEGVLNALLRIPTYSHGARSIEIIIDISQLSNQVSFERSCLPSETQLAPHINGNTREFRRLIEEGSI